MTYSASMTDSYEPPDRGRRIVGYTALGYAIALLLLLALCCYGVYWVDHTIADFLSGD